MCVFRDVTSHIFHPLKPGQLYTISISTTMAGIPSEAVTKRAITSKYSQPWLTQNSQYQHIYFVASVVWYKLELFCYNIYRGSYMSAHVLLNLLNELGERDKMRGLPSILSLFRNEFNKFNNTRARMLDSVYHMTNSLKSHFWRKNVMILSSCTQRCYGRNNVSRKSINH